MSGRDDASYLQYLAERSLDRHNADTIHQDMLRYAHESRGIFSGSPESWMTSWRESISRTDVDALA